MQKRSVIFGAYNTAAHGWTLTGCTLGDAEQKTNYVEKPGGDGSWNLSTVLTNGIPRYKDRPLTVTLECSEGTRDDRVVLISEMINQLDGLEWDIVLPDHPGKYVRGQVHVVEDQNSLAYAKVTVTATCEPWLYYARESIVELTATEAVQVAYIRNGGRRASVPMLAVTGSVRLGYGATSLQLSAGSYKWPALLLTPGIHPLEYSGDGTLTITFREAVLK
jgi:hypothetical protein